MDIEELRRRRDAALAEAKALVALAEDEGRAITPDEQTRFDEAMASYNRLNKDVMNREAITAAETAAAAVVRAVGPAGLAGDGADAVPGGAAAAAAFAGDDLVRRIQVLPPPHARQLIGFAGTGMTQLRNAYRAGMWCRAMIFQDGPARDWCRDNSIETRVMVSETNPKGGALVPPELESAIINLRDTYGMARRWANLQRMGSETQTIPRRTGGVTAYFVGQTAETTASDMAWDQVQLTAKELSALTRLSKTLADDAIIDIAATVAQDMAWAFSKKEDECLVDGDGTSTYGGCVGFRVLMSDGNHDGSYDDATAGDDQFAEMILGDLVALIGKLPTYAHARAAWYISQYGWGAMMLRLMSAAGGNTIPTIMAGAEKEFLGYPVRVCAAMPGKASSNYNEAVMVAFGDLQLAATVGDRRGITIEVDGSRYLEYRQLAVIATERVDVNVHDIGTDSAAGPLVGLRGNTS